MIYQRKNRIRKYFTILIVLGFFTTFSLFLIFLAQGKRFTSSGQIIQTGVVEIISVPTDVSVYIDGKQVSLRDNKIQDVKVGNVNIEIRKDNYTTWKKTINVVNDRVEQVYAQLYPLQFKLEQELKSSIHKAVFSQDQTTLFFTVLNSNIPEQNGLWQYKLSRSFLDFSNDDATKIANFDSSLKNSLETFDYQIAPSRDNSKLTLNIPKLNAIYVYDSTANNKYIDLVNTLGFIPDDFNWFNSSNSLIIKKGSLLFELNVSNGEKKIIHYSPTESPIYSIGLNRIYLVNNNALQFYENGVISNIDLKRFNIRSIEAVYSSPFIDSNIVIKSASNLYYLDIRNSVLNLIDRNSTIVELSTTALKVLYQKDKKLHSYIYNSFSKRGDTTLVENEGKLEKFTKNGLKLISQFENQIILSDTDGKNSISVAKDLDILPGSKVILSDDNKVIYMIINSSGESNNKNYNLYSVSLAE